MIKKILPAILLLACVSFADIHAKGGIRFSYGLEWSYAGTFLRNWQYNYICSEGYRIIEGDSKWRYFSNGGIMANAGADIGSKVNLSIYSGLTGVYFKRWMIPVELRARFCPAGLHKTGLICFAGAGAMFPTSVRRETCLGASAGAGYRRSVFRDISIDFLMSLRIVTDHDQIIDPDSGSYVPTTDITKNAAKYAAFQISAAINF